MRCLVWMFVVSCGAASPLSSLPEQDGVDSLRSADDLLSRMDQTKRLMTRAGWRRVLLAKSSGFVVPGQPLVRLLRFPSAGCFTVVALAASGVRDLDVALYAAGGDKLAEDVERNPEPAIQLCVTNPRERHYLVLRAYDGAGPFAVMTFAGSREDFGRAAAALGTEPARAHGEGMGRPGDETDRLGAFKDGVAKRFFLPSSAERRVSIVVGKTVRLVMPVQRGTCYTVAAFSVSDGKEVNLRVLDGSDEWVAVDHATSRDAAVQFCAREGGAHHVELWGSAREATVQFFEANERNVGSVGNLWLGKRRSQSVNQSTLRVTEQRFVDVTGWTLLRRVREGRLKEGEVVSIKSPAGTSSCMSAAVITGRGGQRIHVTVTGPDGDGRDRQFTGSWWTVAEACDSERLTITSQGGPSRYAVWVLQRRP